MLAAVILAALFLGGCAQPAAPDAPTPTPTECGCRIPTVEGGGAPDAEGTPAPSAADDLKSRLTGQWTMSAARGTTLGGLKAGDRLFFDPMAQAFLRPAGGIDLAAGYRVEDGGLTFIVDGVDDTWRATINAQGELKLWKDNLKDEMTLTKEP